MALTKSEIVDSVQNQLGLTRNQSTQIIETLLETIKKSLEKEEDVMISRFGRFCVKKKAERKGRNPATGDDMMLTPRKVVTFKCSDVLRKQVNGS
jgi:integration host factor subunit alpha